MNTPKPDLKLPFPVAVGAAVGLWLLIFAVFRLVG